MKLVPVEIPEIPIIAPLIASRLNESELNHRLTVDRALTIVHGLIETKTGAAFVDDLLLPTTVVVLQTGISILFEEKFCNVLLIYVDQKTRSLPKALAAVKAVTDYAIQEKCNVICGSAWIYRGSDGIGSLWKHAGFEEQETVWVKHLTN